MYTKYLQSSHIQIFVLSSTNHALPIPILLNPTHALQRLQHHLQLILINNHMPRLTRAQITHIKNSSLTSTTSRAPAQPKPSPHPIQQPTTNPTNNPRTLPRQILQIQRYRNLHWPVRPEEDIFPLIREVSKQRFLERQGRGFGVCECEGEEFRRRVGSQTAGDSEVEFPVAEVGELGREDGVFDSGAGDELDGAVDERVDVVSGEGAESLGLEFGDGGWWGCADGGRRPVKGGGRGAGPVVGVVVEGGLGVGHLAGFTVGVGCFEDEAAVFEGVDDFGAGAEGDEDEVGVVAGDEEDGDAGHRERACQVENSLASF